MLLSIKFFVDHEYVDRSYTRIHRMKNNRRFACRSRMCQTYKQTKQNNKQVYKQANKHLHRSNIADPSSARCNNIYSNYLGLHEHQLQYNISIAPPQLGSRKNMPSKVARDTGIYTYMHTVGGTGNIDELERTSCRSRILLLRPPL